LLRSCYRTQMRFFSEDGNNLVPVRWYFCAPEAEPLPFPTRFNSANWDSQKGQEAFLGESRLVPRPYVKGDPPPWSNPPET
jgi:hypothetical protein